MPHAPGHNKSAIIAMGEKGSSILDPKSQSLINIELLGDSAKLPNGNEENRKLEEELVVERRKLLKCKTEIEGIQQKTDALWRLMNNIRIDLNENQSLLRAKTAALDSEQSLCKSAKEESQKAITEWKKLEAELCDRQSRYDRAKATVEKQRKVCENLHKNKRVDQQQFQSIVDEIVDTDDVNIAIQKYMILDEKAATELNNQLIKLCEQISAKKRDLDGVTVELKALETALNRANGEFEKEQADRNRLIRRWEQAVELLKKRDDEMETVRKQAEEFRSEEMTWRDTLLEKEMECRDQRATEIELRRTINQIDQQLSKLRSELVKREMDLQHKQDRYLTVHSLAHNERSAVRSEELQLAQLKEQVESNQKKLDEAGRAKAERQKQMESGKLQNESIESRKIRLNKEIQLEQRKLESIAKTKRTLLGQITRKRELIANGKKQQADMQGEEEILKSLQQNLATKMKQLEKQIAKQKELTEGKEIEIKRLERQIGEAKADDKGDTELASLNQRIESRGGLMAEKEATEQTWTSTIKICQVEMEKAKAQLDKLTLARQDLEQSKLVHESEIAILEKRLKKAQDQKQETVVQYNLLQSEMKRLQDVLENKKAEVNNVGQATEAQQRALQDQEQRLKQRRNELQGKTLQMEEERKKIVSRVNEVRCKVNTVISRYDAHVRGLPAGDESNLTAEDIASKKARERIDLEKAHQEMSMKLNKAEKEATAVQNTMRLITERNETFRQAVIQADRNSPEYQEKLLLEAQYQATNERYRNARLRIKQYQTKMEDLKEKAIGKERNLIQMDIESKRDEEEISRLKAEIADQQDKLDRWTVQNEAMVSGFERAGSARQNSFIRSDIELRSITATNSVASKALSELSRNADINNLITEYCLKNGLELESPSDSGVGSALNRRSTVPVKNGDSSARKKLDSDTLPPISSKVGKPGRTQIKLESYNGRVRRGQSTGQTALSQLVI